MFDMEKAKKLYNQIIEIENCIEEVIMFDMEKAKKLYNQIFNGDNRTREIEMEIRRAIINGHKAASIYCGNKEEEVHLYKFLSETEFEYHSIPNSNYKVVEIWGWAY